MGILDLFRKKEARFTAKEIKEITELAVEKRKNSNGSFVSQWREMNALQQEMRAQKEAELDEAIEQYGLKQVGDDDTDTDKMMVQTLLKHFLKANNPIIATPEASGFTPDGAVMASPVTAPPGLIPDDEAAKQVAENIKKQKLPKKFLEAMKDFNGADFEKIKRWL